METDTQPGAYINVSHRGLRLQVCHLWTKEVVCHLWRTRRDQLWWGPPYTSHEVGAFLSAWGVQHRVSSARYPQSNGRAELSIKTAKRLIYDNTKHGSLDTASSVLYSSTGIPHCRRLAILQQNCSMAAHYVITFPTLWIWPTFALNGWQWPMIVS